MQTTIIQQKYNTFIESYQSMPTVVKVVIEWKDNKQRHDYFISLDDYWVDDFLYPYRNTEIGFLAEEDIFYHAGSFQGLLNLATSNGEDFKILDIIDFY